MHLYQQGHLSRRRFGKINFQAVGCIGGPLLLLGFVCAGGCGGGLYWLKNKADKDAKEAERQAQHQVILDALNPELPSYLAAPKEQKEQRNPLQKRKFKGKVVCIDKVNKRIDEDSLDNLPAALKATKPDEVGAVAWLNWREEDSGSYPDGTKAKIQIVLVTLIDKKTGETLVLKEITGDMLEQKLGNGDRTGPKPWKKVADFLQEWAEVN